MSKGKYLAIDYGDRRVGLAISDFDKQIAFPRDFLEYKKTDELIDQIKIFCREGQIIKVIVGLPVEMDGTMGERVIKTYEFGDKLKKAIHPTPVEYFDERLTTKEATRKLHQQGIKEREQKGQKDMVSAQIILEAYLKNM
ncbi:Holliday junction resolvase RuvX [Candidatus Peregrinibacteria bacterium]|nr:Holliday junction resolvase RuvX [Candidatus Peregrinibacteria bacterium]